MPSQDAIEVIHTLLFFCAIPLQILLISTLYRYRKQDSFKTPFFKLLLSVTVNDLMFCALYVPLNIWFLLGAYEKYPYMMATAMMAILSTCFTGSAIGMALIAINRFINIVFFIKAAALWTDRSTKLAIGFQWSVALTYAFCFVHPDTHFMFKQKYEVTQVAPNSTASLGHAVYGILVGFGCILIVVICYTACMVKLLHHKIKNSDIVGNDFSAEIRLFASGISLSAFMIVEFVTYVFFIFACGYQYCSVLHAVLSYASICGNFYSSAPIAFVMSSELRNHARMLLKKNQVAPVIQKRQTRNETKF